MGTRRLAFAALAALCLAASAWCQGGTEEPATFVTGIDEETGGIKTGIDAVGRDIGTIGDITDQILAELAKLNADIEKLKTNIGELQRLNGQAETVIEALNERIDLLVARAKTLGDRYLKAIDIAEDYKARYKKASLLSIILGTATVVLGGALIGVAVAK
jgi:septal ring factor EnvC (AmiA/AmiB activator)